MKFGWGHIFLLAKRMFLINEARIAESLKVHRSTVYRHIQNPTRRFDPAVNVYTAIFKLPDNKPETEQQYYKNLCISLESDIFPPDFRTPKFKRYRESIEYLIKQADETGGYAKKKIPFQVQSEVKLVSRGIDRTDFKSEIELERPQIPELSEPMYYGEYCSMSLSSMFDMYPGFKSSAPLDPALKEKWGLVRVTDEFYKSIKDYGIEDFLAITPSYLPPMEDVLTDRNVVNHIRSAVQFVEHMRPAMEHMMISNENKEIFEDISNFVVRLDQYLNLLRETFNNSGLISGDKKLEQKANEYYDELKSRLENLEKRLESEDECRPNND